jgi:cell division protein FtsW
MEGGFFGRGPAEGTIKNVLPDAHTDFIFAVVGEEYGGIACLGLVGLFAYIVLRAMGRIIDEPDSFTRLAVTGLSVLFGLQALINMAVNVGLMPPKGMTLPFISAGGSSTLAIALSMGLVLALTRRRPDANRLNMPRLATEAPLAPQLGRATR